MSNDRTSSTVLRDIDIPFFRLVAIILKFMFASIPALIIFYAILFGLVLAIAAVFGGAAGLLHQFNLPQLGSPKF